MKCGAKQGSFTDSDDGSIIERCQRLYLGSNRFNGWSTNEERVEWRFSQYWHRQISFKTFPLAAKCVATDANVHRSQQWLTCQRIIRLSGQQYQSCTCSPNGEAFTNFLL